MTTALQSKRSRARRGSSQSNRDPNTKRICRVGHHQGCVQQRRNHLHVILYSGLMETLPLSDARSTLSSIIERVEGTHERVTITRNGRPAAVLISPEDLEALEETLDVLSDPATMKQLHKSEAAVAVGDVLDEAGLRELVAKRAP